MTKATMATTTGVYWLWLGTLRSILARAVFSRGRTVPLASACRTAEYVDYVTIASGVAFWLWAIIEVRSWGGRRRFQDVGVQVGLTRAALPEVPAAPEPTATPRIRLRLQERVWIAPVSGKKYHFDGRCGGFAQASRTKAFPRCDRCVATLGI